MNCRLRCLSLVLVCDVSADLIPRGTSGARGTNKNDSQNTQKDDAEGKKLENRTEEDRMPVSYRHLTRPTNLLAETEAGQ